MKRINLVEVPPISTAEQLWSELKKCGGMRVIRGVSREALQIQAKDITERMKRAILNFAKGASIPDKKETADLNALVTTLSITSAELHAVPEGEPKQERHVDMPGGKSYVTLIIPVTNHYGTEFQHKGWTVQSKACTLHSGSTVHNGPANYDLPPRMFIAVVFSKAGTVDPNVITPTRYRDGTLP